MSDRSVADPGAADDEQPAATSSDAERSAGAEDAPERRQRPKRHPVVAFVREVAIVLVSALVISLVLKTFFIQPFHIPSVSMETTLDVGDRPYIGFLGTLEPRKNVPALIRAWVQAYAGTADAPALVLAGHRVASFDWIATEAAKIAEDGLRRATVTFRAVTEPAE